MNNLLLNLSIEFLLSGTYFLFFNFYLLIHFIVSSYLAKHSVLSSISLTTVCIIKVWLWEYVWVVSSVCLCWFSFILSCLTCLVLFYNCVLDIIFAELFVEIIRGLTWCFSLLVITHICFCQANGALKIWSHFNAVAGTEMFLSGAAVLLRAS